MMTQRKMILSIGIALLFAAAIPMTGCKKPNPWMLTTISHLPHPRGAPTITKVEDLGTTAIIQGKPLDGSGSDGSIVPGEVLVIRGNNFGRLPSVALGKKTVEVLGRLEDGGIIIRVPWGLEPGETILSINTPRGSGSKRINLRRFAVAAITGMDNPALLEIHRDGIKDTGVKLNTGKIQATAGHRLGAHGYLATPSGEIHTVDFAANGGPSVVGKRTAVEGKLKAFSSAMNADRLVTIIDDNLVLWDTYAPDNPLPWKGVKIPENIVQKNIIGAALSPDGLTLVILLSGFNGFVLADVTDTANVRWFDPVRIHSEEDPLLVRRLMFMRQETGPPTISKTPGETTPLAQAPERPPAEQILWILSGDNDESLRIGRHPTSAVQYEILSARTGTDEPAANKKARFSLEDSNPPLEWSYSLNPQQIRSGTAFRDAPAQMSFFIVAADAGLFELPKPLDTPPGHQQALELHEKTTAFSKLLEIDGTGRIRAKHKPEKSIILGPSTITTDGKMLVSVACNAEPTTEKEERRISLGCGLFWMDMTHKTMHFEPMTKPELNLLAPPFDFGDVFVQP